jgi:hypothetical protein
MPRRPHYSYEELIFLATEVLARKKQTRVDDLRGKMTKFQEEANSTGKTIIIHGKKKGTPHRLIFPTGTEHHISCARIPKGAAKC